MECAKGFSRWPEKVQPPRGSYVSETVNSFVFQDHKEVCFMTNVFPEHMDSQVHVATLQPEGILQKPLTPSVCLH